MSPREPDLARAGLSGVSSERVKEVQKRVFSRRVTLEETGEKDFKVEVGLGIGTEKDRGQKETTKE